jgi:anti-sigma factor RsiW
MMKRCLDEGILQAYVDGELSPAEMSEAASHLAACEACAASLVAAESESAFFSAAFAPDGSVSVPTEALRARINAVVAQLESAPAADSTRTRGWSLGGLLSSLSPSFKFTPQSAAAFASLLAVVAFALIYFAVNRQPNKPAGSNQNVIAKNEAPTQPPTPQAGRPADNDQPRDSNVENNGSQPPAQRNQIIRASYRRPRVGSRANERPATEQQKAPQLLPGEKDYQEAIASLEKTIKLGGDAALKPALRVDYERNLAILDNAIAQTRQVAAQNPKDKDAAGFLMSAYQSKVELLTKIADQTQIAALGR